MVLKAHHYGVYFLVTVFFFFFASLIYEVLLCLLIITFCLQEAVWVKLRGAFLLLFIDEDVGGAD